MNPLNYLVHLTTTYYLNPHIFDKGVYKWQVVTSTPHSHLIVSKMKTLLLLFVCLVAPSIGQFEDCELCKQFAGNLANFLVTPDEIQSQIEILKLEACPEFDNQDWCTEGVDTWYEGMAKALFGRPETPEGICVIAGKCPPPSGIKQEVDCERCKNGMATLGELISRPETVARAVELLTGDLYCAQQDFMDQGVTEDCQMFVTDFSPVGLPVLGAVLAVDAEAICNAIADNVCA